jgi:MFS family permease
VISQRRPPFFYGWVIVGCSWLANFCTVSMNPLVFAFFLEPMTQDLGIGRSTLVWGITIRLISGGFFAPYLGRLVDRYGARWLGVASGVLVASVLFGFAVAQSIWVYYALFFLSGLTGFGIFGGNVLTMVPPGNWFVARRGRAMSIAQSGQLLGSAATTIAAAFLIEEFGWRTAWAILGFVALIGVVPAYALLMRRRPEDVGLFPDGAPGPPVSPTPTAATATRPAYAERDFTVREALRTPVLWLHLGATTLLMTAISPFLLFRNEYWNGLGFSPGLIALGVALDPFIFAVANISMGVVAERIPIRFTGCLGSAFRLCGMLPLTLGATWPASVFVHNLVWGTGSGTTAVFQTLMIPDYFGRTNQGAIRGAITPIMVVFGALGGPLGGYLLDVGMSYNTFFWAIFVAVAIAGVSFFFQTPPARPREDVVPAASVEAARPG